jgi:FtsH-binding integral membrane protein
MVSLEPIMSADTRLVCLRIALVVVGLIAIFAVYPLFQLWPSGWSWGHGHSHYPMMIVGIYATLGVFLLLAARNPLEHRSLIWFAVWSSIVHGGIMAVQAITDDAERGHLVGDVPALFLIALVLGGLMPRRAALLNPKTAAPHNSPTARSTPPSS